MVGPETARKLSNVPLSNNSVGRRITEMADDIKVQLKEKLQKCEFISIQIDESTDVSSLAQFVCFVRFENGENVEEDILFCKPLPDHATGEEMFKHFVSATALYNIDWKKCVLICSDGAKALTGKKSGFVTRLATIMPNAIWVHCFLHRQALASKDMPTELKEVLNDTVKSVNFVKSRPLQSRLFPQLCEEMGAEYKCLLLHTEARWLSRDNLSKLTVAHLKGLREQIIGYIPDDDHAGSRWVLNPFNELTVGQAGLNPQLHDKLIELSCDKTLQLSFSAKDVDKFWLDRRTEYPSLTTAALRILTPFATSYLFWSSGSGPHFHFEGPGFETQRE
ncbi:zinc finger BED domain-containing protein 5-like [Ischnura elegans]|uniref:zinc finger BED domain-containing protein 5-like n=1 Tax=Ischnura elegans TaxID=197161 RepID=UPI001ED86F6D|nr:zinc finger BED domain-containing protein 5-like [Ischnura elegans]